MPRSNILEDSKNELKYIEINSTGAAPTANGSDSIAIGEAAATDNADFSTDRCIAIGNGARVDPTPSTGANSDDSIAIGSLAWAKDGVNIVAIGNGASGTTSRTIAIGQDANASATTAVAIGRDTTASAQAALALGHSADATSTNSIAIGNNSISAHTDAIVIGNAASSNGGESVAIGFSTSASSKAIAIGDDALASTGGISLGDAASGSGSSCISIGDGAQTLTAADRAIAIGDTAIVDVNSDDAIAIGSDTSAEGIASIVIGHNAATDNAAFATDRCIVIGENASVDTTPTTGAVSSSSIAIGDNASVTDGTFGIALGRDASCVGSSNPIAIGQAASGDGDNAISIGPASNADANDAVAIGNNADVFNLRGIAIGSASDVTANEAIAIGYTALVTGANAVQIGAGTNGTANTLQFLTTQLANSSGLVTAHNETNYSAEDSNIDTHLSGIDAALANKVDDPTFNTPGETLSVNTTLTGSSPTFIDYSPSVGSLVVTFPTGLSDGHRFVLSNSSISTDYQLSHNGGTPGVTISSGEYADCYYDATDDSWRILQGSSYTKLTDGVI